MACRSLTYLLKHVKHVKVPFQALVLYIEFEKKTRRICDKKTREESFFKKKEKKKRENDDQKMII